MSVLICCVNVYFISGLCTSCEIFRDVRLPPPFQTHWCEWVDPKPNEPFHVYIKRLTANINTTKPFSIVGLSFGGMIAIELSKTLKPVHTVIISSVTQHKHIPILYRTAGALGLYNLVTKNMINAFRPVVDWFIGAKRSKEEMIALHKTIEQLPENLLRWSLKNVLRWKNTVVPSNLFHIHGGADRLLPVGNMKPNVLIEDGSHFMIVSHAKQIGRIITQRLSGEI